MNYLGIRQLMILVVMLLGVIANLAGCSRGFYGWRPDQVQVNVSSLQAGKDTYEEYVKVRQFAIDMTEAYDTRAGFNRSAIYAGNTGILGLSTANTGIAAFGHAASAAGKGVPLATTFINGLFGIFDNRQLANAYTTAANKLRRTVPEFDSSFLQAPTMEEKAKKITELEAKVLEIISEVEEARNNALPDARTAVQRAIQAKDEVEEALSIKPRITSVTPVVTDQAAGTKVTVQGSGFDSKTTVLLSGVPVNPVGFFVSEKEITFQTPAVKDVTVHSILIRNRFEREAVAPGALAQADLKVDRCEPLERTRDSKSVVVLVHGVGFQKDGSINFETKPPSKVIKRFWRAHTEWEIELDNSNPSQVITASKVEVSNKRPANQKPVPVQDIANCSVAAAP